MKRHRFLHGSEFPFPAEEVFRWHLRPDSVQRLIPPWMDATTIFSTGGPAEEKSRVGMNIKWGPCHQKWILEHVGFKPGREFSERQVQGPFPYWFHTHRVKSLDASSSWLEDEIFYSVPFYLSHLKVEDHLRKIFSYRHETLKKDLLTYGSYSCAPLRILISGSSGLVGSALTCFLRLGGHQIVHLVRKKKAAQPDEIIWDPSSGAVQNSDFEQFDAFIHLAGESIADGLWTKGKKERIFQSRCRDTWLLAQIIHRLQHPPKTVICASAVGIYGDRSEKVTEESPPGKGFLADVCVKWEAATKSLEERGIRVIHTRFGYILSSRGGLLRKLLPLFRLGLGGKIGGGQQMIPWVALEDVVDALYHVLLEPEIKGPVNIVSPYPVKQEEFANLLAELLHAHLYFSIPKWCLKGEKMRELLLASIEAVPQKLKDSGFLFRYPDLRDVLSYNIPII
jgi:uncharacterized protein